MFWTPNIYGSDKIGNRFIARFIPKVNCLVRGWGQGHTLTLGRDWRGKTSYELYA